MKCGRDNRYRQELERMAFLYLCGGRDRKLLSGKEGTTDIGKNWSVWLFYIYVGAETENYCLEKGG